MTWEEAARGPFALVLGTGDKVLGGDALPALLVLARLAMTSNMALTSRSFLPHPDSGVPNAAGPVVFELSMVYGLDTQDMYTVHLTRAHTHIFSLSVSHFHSCELCMAQDVSGWKESASSFCVHFHLVP